MRLVYWVLRKDLLRFLADRNGALMVVLLPVVLASLFGAVFSGSRSVDKINLLVVVQDEGPQVEAFVQALEAEASITVELTDEEAARRAVEEGESGVALIIPKGAEALLDPVRLFAGGGELKAELLYDPSRKTEADIVSGMLLKTQMELLAPQLTDPKKISQVFGDLRPVLALNPSLEANERERWLGFLDAGIELSDSEPLHSEETEEGAILGGGLQPPMAIEATEVSGGLEGEYNSYAQNFAGMLTMFLLFMAIQMASHLINERQSATLKRVQMTRVGKLQLLGGTALATAIIAIAATSIVYLVGFIAFGIKVHGSWLGFAAVGLAMSAFVGAFAVLLAALGKSEKQINTIGTFLVLIFSFLGGSMIPSFLMPEAVQRLAQAIPNYWITYGLSSATWRGLPMSQSLLAAAIVSAFAALFMVIAVRTFRWKSP